MERGNDSRFSLSYPFLLIRTAMRRTSGRGEAAAPYRVRVDPARTALTGQTNMARLASMKVSSISELKDGLSAHLELVRAGEIVVVTDRKSPVATLERIKPGTLSVDLAAMISGGIVAPRKEPLDVEAFMTMPIGSCDRGLSTAIVEERQEEGR